MDASGKLFVVDSDSRNRILIWNTFPTQNGQAADVVVGQPDMTTGSSGTSASTFNGIYGVYVAAGRLFVADSDNNRVLIFNSIPTSNGASADIVIGQSAFTSGSINQAGSAAANTFSGPGNVFAYDDKLLVTDSGNARVLLFDNIINTPSISIEQPVGSTDGKLRISGNVRVDAGNYGIWKLEASVNGGSYGAVSNLTKGIHYVGRTDPVTGTFFHDFEPWANNNGGRDDWVNKQAQVLKQLGYTIKFRGYNNNADLVEHALYFQPFTLSLPATIPTRPTIIFSVVTQRTEIKDNLDHYEVWVKKEGGEWQKYIDQIPVDYDLVKGREDNLRKTDAGMTNTTGNGTFENANILASFSNASSTVAVRKKGSQAGTVLLVPGKYQVKVTAVDKAGHTQDTEPATVTVTGSASNPRNLAITSEWFPLQVNSMSGVQSGILANFNPAGVKPTYSSTTSVPTLMGVAFAGTTVTLTVTDTAALNYRTYTATTKPDSTWSITPTLYRSSLVDISVEDAAGKYSELPSFALVRATPSEAPATVQGVSSDDQEIPTVPTRLPTPEPNPTPATQTEPVAPSQGQSCFLFWCW